MALILACYQGYVIRRIGNYEKFDNGYRAYFDTDNRDFLWLKPEDACNSSQRLVLLPIISEYETYRSFLRTHGLESVIQAYDSLSEKDFCVAVRKEGDDAGFLQALSDYTGKEWEPILQQWIEDNGIENCKVSCERYKGPLVTKEDARAYLQFVKAQNEYEDAQEEAFKKSRLEQSNGEVVSTEQLPESNKKCD